MDYTSRDADIRRRFVRKAKGDGYRLPNDRRKFGGYKRAQSLQKRKKNEEQMIRGLEQQLQIIHAFIDDSSLDFSLSPSNP